MLAQLVEPPVRLRDPRLQMNLYSFLRTIPAHQRHHLWLAERIRMILAQADALEVAL